MYGSMPELNGDVVESSETLPMERERETFANIVQDIRGDEWSEKYMTCILFRFRCLNIV